MVGWLDGWMVGWLDGWMLGWLDGSKNQQPKTEQPRRFGFGLK
jgi:hypothetical protein